MDEVGLGLGDLRDAARRLGLRNLLGRGDTPSDAGQLRMTFPCHVAISLRSGGVLEADGREHGGSGAPLAEQQQVVYDKFVVTREAAEIPKAWRRPARPAATAPSG